MRNDRPTGTSEFKAVAEEAGTLVRHCAAMALDWLEQKSRPMRRHGADDSDQDSGRGWSDSVDDRHQQGPTARGDDDVRRRTTHRGGRAYRSRGGKAESHGGRQNAGDRAEDRTDDRADTMRGYEDLDKSRRMYGGFSDDIGGRGYRGYDTGPRDTGNPPRGGYRGIGPKGYARPDHRIAEDLNERLADDDDIDASSIEVRVDNAVVTLDGSVRHRWMKHRAEDIAESCRGVRDVENRIRVTTEHSAGNAAGNPVSPSPATTPPASSSTSRAGGRTTATGTVGTGGGDLPDAGASSADTAAGNKGPGARANARKNPDGTPSGNRSPGGQ